MTTHTSEPTDEMVTQAVDKFLRSAGVSATIGQIDNAMRDVLTDAMAAERERIKNLLTIPLLKALRCIPDGTLQNGCIVGDGATARENARQAYLAAFREGDAS